MARCAKRTSRRPNTGNGKALLGYYAECQMIRNGTATPHILSKHAKGKYNMQSREAKRQLDHRFKPTPLRDTLPEHMLISLGLR